MAVFLKKTLTFRIIFATISGTVVICKMKSNEPFFMESGVFFFKFAENLI